MPHQPNPVNWFEIPVSDMSRARNFYQTVLETELAPPIETDGNIMSFFPMDMQSPGAAGALFQHPHVEPSPQGVTIYFSVPYIDPVLQRIPPAGGSVCMTRTDIGEWGFIAQFLDSEGNRVALHERPAGAM